MSKKTQETGYLTLIQAPGIPEYARKELEAHWKASELTPDSTLVLNYECRVDIITIYSGSKLLVIAPEIPISEVRKLKKNVAKARKSTRREDRLIVVNYECRIDAI